MRCMVQPDDISSEGKENGVDVAREQRRIRTGASFHQHDPTVPPSRRPLPGNPILRNECRSGTSGATAGRRARKPHSTRPVQRLRTAGSDVGALEGMAEESRICPKAAPALRNLSRVPEHLGVTSMKVWRQLVQRRSQSRTSKGRDALRTTKGQQHLAQGADASSTTGRNDRCQ